MESFVQKSMVDASTILAEMIETTTIVPTSTMCHHVSGLNILKIDVEIECLDTQSELKIQYFKYVMIGCLGYLFRQKKSKNKKQCN